MRRNGEKIEYKKKPEGDQSGKKNQCSIDDKHEEIEIYKREQKLYGLIG